MEKMRRSWATSYDRLRTLEHRLQMVADQQTHSLPGDPAALDNVARLEGLEGSAALVAELEAITEAVGTRYDRLLASICRGRRQPAPVRGGGAALTETLAGLGLCRSRRLGHPDRKLAIGQAARAAQRCGPRGVRCDAVAAAERLCPGAGAGTRTAALGAIARRPAQRSQSIPAAGSTAGTGAAARPDLGPCPAVGRRARAAGRPARSADRCHALSTCPALSMS
jgi:hypothetical protein